MPDNHDSDFYLTPTESESIESLVSDLSGTARESLDGETFNQLDEYRLARQAQDLPRLGRSTLGAIANQLEKSGDGTVARNEFGDVTELFFRNAFEECVKVGI
ncbi:MAG: hypothetical protein K2Z81_17615, partial [Cyanobacteria bacterium]|nr:hypothetical protein [Cyanobacteriota bacterium]